MSDVGPEESFDDYLRTLTSILSAVILNALHGLYNICFTV